jgi:hypothetical protein
MSMCFARSLLFSFFLRHIRRWRISLRALLYVGFHLLKLFALQGVCAVGLLHVLQWLDTELLENLKQGQVSEKVHYSMLYRTLRSLQTIPLSS